MRSRQAQAGQAIDSKELDTQLHGAFAEAGVYRRAQMHAESIAGLRGPLAADRRYVFTLIQKLQPVKDAPEMR